MIKRLIFITFGILVFYAISNIYLEKILFLEDLTAKTVFSLLYLFVLISPVLYFWLKGKLSERFIVPILVLFVGIFYTSALMTIPVPVGRDFPDVDYHGAKVLYCSTGNFFNDPVTSFPSIYPSVYHIILGSIMWVLGSDNSWYILNRFHILMLITLFLSVYLIANSLFNPRVGLLSVLFFGAIIDMPTVSGMFFPTPFMLGLTMIINSVTLVYLAIQDNRRWCLYPAGLMAGLAVTIWPAFLPVALILTIIIFFAPDRRLRRLLDLLKFILPCMIFPLIVWIPQYLLLTSYHLLGHHSIGQYKGIPELSWFLDFAVKFIFLGGFVDSHKWAVVLFGINYVILIAFAIMGFRSVGEQVLLKKRFLKLFFVLMLVALPVVHYVFTFTYSRRFQVLFSTLIVIVAAYYLLVKLGKKCRLLAIAFIVWTVGFTGVWNLYKVHEYVLENKKAQEIREKCTLKVLEFIESNTTFGEYIFATERTYRNVVFGNLIRFNLVVHREGSYYSLNPKLSEIMLNHYNTILYSDDFRLIRKILNFYKIRYILIHKKEPPFYPGLKLSMENCKPAYKDEWFTVFKLE